MTKAERWRRYWDRKSAGYDAEMGVWDRRLFGDSREWACGQADGEVLEVAAGTGLNLPHYPAEVTLTGLDLSDGMLAIARDRARRLGRPVTLRVGDAHRLPFADGSFDAVVCTFGLCAIPDPAAAVGEMARVLRPDGRLILVDHVASSSRLVRAVQWLVELASVPLAGEHFRRRPLKLVEALGLPVERRERFKLGLVERLVARKIS
ncbi:class I SAM-dependent methyltransferase [Amycolatopsis sp. MtRt-6]|uniref:class I SAM-dependent methyltransferase n=1 Tax=Amycolatopsis sp. MtRt-6 TaxID=2792782 RepID=UPI001A8EEF0A|nr:class I SAM-dependent methyltransferase [Amycolatopsis sp. MtRt-6]